MKKRLLILAQSAFAICACAQTNVVAHNHPAKSFHDLLLSSLLKTKAARTANKTTAVAERLISDSWYGMTSSSGSGPGVLTFEDSVDFRYHGSNHSQFDYSNMSYNYQDGLAPSPLNSQLRGNAVLDILYDTMREWGNTGFGAIDTESTASIVYGPANQVQQFKYHSPYTTYNSDREIDGTFDASGKEYLTDYYNNLSASSTALSLSYKVYSEYDATTGYLIKDSTYSYNPTPRLEGKNIYSYNATGNLIHMASYYRTATGWVLSNVYDVFYNSADQPGKMVGYTVDTSGASQVADVDTFGWTAGINYVTYKKSEHYNNGLLQSRSIWNKHITATTHLPDTTSYNYTFYNTSDTIYQNYFSLFTYNSNLNPIREMSYYFDTATSGYDTNYIRHYYYESYTPEGIINTAFASPDMTVYPNPAANAINVSFGNLPAISSIHLKLINTTGQVVAERDTDCRNGVIELSLARLVPGVYRLVAEDVGTHALYYKSIVKQ